MASHVRKQILTATILGALTIAAHPAAGASIGYVQTNLTSDINGIAANFDPNLKNPWGVSFSNTSPFWVSDQATDVSTLYNAAGAPLALVVSTPPSPGPGPTGQVFVGGMGFTLANGTGSAIFVFSTLAGTIDAWNGGTSAITQFAATDGAIYTGLALAGNNLYAADTRNGRIDVFDNTFHPTTVTGNFVDPSVPAGFTPYNIQNINGNLYVEYAKFMAPGGYVGVFNANGVFQMHISDPHLNAPWGVALAPASFGKFGGDLLVGNFGDGTINAFDPGTGTYLGTVSDAKGNPLVNSGLWALDFRSATSGFDPNTLFFTAGINNQADGIFGTIQAIPETATVLEYDFYERGTTTVGASFLFVGFVRDISPASTPFPRFMGFTGPSPSSLIPCDLTSNSSAELDCRAPTVHSGIFYFVFDYGAFPEKLGPFTGSGFVAPDGAVPGLNTVNLLNGQVIALQPGSVTATASGQ